MKAHSEIANSLWGTATLHDDFNRRHEDVILPFVGSRIDSVLGEELWEVQQNIVEMMKGVTA